MFLLELQSGDMIDPYKIECVRMFNGKKHLKMTSGEVIELTDFDLESIENALNEDAEEADVKKETLENIRDSLAYIENFLHRYAKKNGISGGYYASKNHIPQFDSSCLFSKLF